MDTAGGARGLRIHRPLDCEKAHLVLRGDGPLRSLIEYAIQRRGVAGIRVLGFVDEETKAQQMKNSRWVVVPPNTREDFGLAAIEARHLGVPCIITRDGGLPEAGGRICRRRSHENARSVRS